MAGRGINACIASLRLRALSDGSRSAALLLLLIQQPQRPDALVGDARLLGQPQQVLEFSGQVAVVALANQLLLLQFFHHLDY